MLQKLLKLTIRNIKDSDSFWVHCGRIQIAIPILLSTLKKDMGLVVCLCVLAFRCKMTLLRHKVVRETSCVLDNFKRLRNINETNLGCIDVLNWLIFGMPLVFR